jgi:hypothetical protein
VQIRPGILDGLLVLKPVGVASPVLEDLQDSPYLGDRHGGRALCEIILEILRRIAQS